MTAFQWTFFVVGLAWTVCFLLLVGLLILAILQDQQRRRIRPRSRVVAPGGESSWEWDADDDLTDRRAA